MPATIKLGSTDATSGGAVTQWQTLLSGAGFVTAVTGSFDASTEQATKAWQAAKGLTADGIVGPKSWTAMGVLTKSFPPTYKKDADFGRQILQKVWFEVTGEEPNLATLQIAGAQAQLESGYGKAQYRLLDHSSPCIPPGQIVLASSGVINNWGAVQTSEGPPGGFLATDTSPNKKTASNPCGFYDHHYKVYPDAESGARHFVEHMTKKRPTSWALMKTGDIDAWADQMHKSDPVTGIGLYFEQDPGQRAMGIEQRVWAIADALGEPVAAQRGGPMPTQVQPGEPSPEGEGPLETITRNPLGLAALVAGLAAGGYYLLAYIGWPFKIPRIF